MSTLPRNRLLRKLPLNAREALMAAGEAIHLPPRTTLIAPHESIDYVYFPESGEISVALPTVGDGLASVLTIGYEGMIGAELSSAVNRVPRKYSGHIEGMGLSVSTAKFLELSRDYPIIDNVCRQYTLELLDQMMREHACSQIHTVSERCAKLLLFSYERCHGQTFKISQLKLSELLGASRTMVNQAHSNLAKLNLIEYSRTIVKVRDYEGLKRLSCLCYAAMAAILVYELGKRPPRKSKRSR